MHHIFAFTQNLFLENFIFHNFKSFACNQFLNTKVWLTVSKELLGSVSICSDSILFLPHSFSLYLSPPLSFSFSNLWSSSCSDGVHSCLCISMCTIFSPFRRTICSPFYDERHAPPSLFTFQGDQSAQGTNRWLSRASRVTHWKILDVKFKSDQTLRDGKRSSYVLTQSISALHFELCIVSIYL